MKHKWKIYFKIILNNQNQYLQKKKESYQLNCLGNTQVFETHAVHK